MIENLVIKTKLYKEYIYIAAAFRYPILFNECLWDWYFWFDLVSEIFIT